MNRQEQQAQNLWEEAAMPKIDYSTGEVFYRGQWLDLSDYDAKREAEKREEEEEGYEN